MRKLLTLGLLLLMTASVQPQTMTGWRITTSASWGFDSSNYPPDSVIGYYAGGVFGGDADSMRRITTSINEPEGWPFPDTLSRYALLTTANIGDVAINPSVEFKWYLPDGQILRDNSPQTVMMIRRVDSNLVGAGLSGSGEFICSLFVLDTSNGALVVGAAVQVRDEDTAAFLGGQQATDVGGFVVYALDNTSANGYAVSLTASTFFVETAYQLIEVSGNTVDTLRVYVYAVVQPATNDSSVITVFTKVPFAQLEAEPNAQTIQMKNGNFVSTAVRTAEANSDGVISISLPRTDSTNQKVKWTITVKDTQSPPQQMVRVKNFKVEAVNFDTLITSNRNR